MSVDASEALFEVGRAHLAAGRAVAAAAAFAKVAALNPGSASARVNLAIAEMAAGRAGEAGAAARGAVAIDPSDAKCWITLGSAWKQAGDPSAAVDAYRRAIALSPGDAEARNNLGGALMDCGEVAAGVEAYRRALALSPDNPRIHSNLLYALHFDERVDAEGLFDAHRAWSVRHEAPLLSTRRPHENDRDRGRRLRVGYVSPNFYDHPVGRFIAPLVAAHDRGGFHVTCYADLRTAGDATTAALRAAADAWVETTGLSDEALAERVRGDRIDILVDLCAHMAGNRLLAFARRPAPVQVTYLAYPGTTGLRSMDYRLTDGGIDPPGAAEFYAERSLRLGTYWCYPAPGEAGEVGALPAEGNGYVTFAALNNPAKDSAGAMEAWAAILRGVPGSRLLLHAREGSHRGRVLEGLVARGVGADRVELVPFLSRGEYFRTYGRTDVALDPFPYAGGTTTCDALWCGNPAVTLVGRTAVGRGGASILPVVGLGELVARTGEEYVAAAVRLAGDVGRLGGVRAGLRARMRGSRLMDAGAFARDVEAAYRGAWGGWCSGSRR